MSDEEALSVGVTLYVKAADANEGDDSNALAEVERNDETTVQLRADPLNDIPSVALTLSLAAAVEIGQQLLKRARQEW